MKYKIMAQTKRQHEYLGLPGKFRLRYPQEVVFPDMDTGRMDELYLNDQDILIDYEEESEQLGPKTFKKYNKYNKFVRYIYNKEVYHVAICHKDPKKEHICYKAGPSNYIKIHCIHISQKELWKRCENVISKVEQKEELTDTEALDMAFVSKFIAPQHRQFVIDSMTKSFENAIIKDKKLKLDVAVILDAMISKHIPSETKQKELRERINMREYRDEMEKIIYEEYGDKLYEKDRVIEKKDSIIEEKDSIIEKKDTIIEENEKKLQTQTQELQTEKQENKKLTKTNNEYKNKIKQLNKIENLTPEAKKIINSLMLL
jgi:hypothetical protein